MLLSLFPLIPLPLLHLLLLFILLHALLWPTIPRQCGLPDANESPEARPHWRQNQSYTRGAAKLRSAAELGISHISEALDKKVNDAALLRNTTIRPRTPSDSIAMTLLLLMLLLLLLLLRQRQEEAGCSAGTDTQSRSWCFSRQRQKRCKSAWLILAGQKRRLGTIGRQKMLH